MLASRCLPTIFPPSFHQWLQQHLHMRKPCFSVLEDLSPPLSHTYYLSLLAEMPGTEFGIVCIQSRYSTTDFQIFCKPRRFLSFVGKYSVCNQVSFCRWPHSLLLEYEKWGPTILAEGFLPHLHFPPPQLPLALVQLPHHHHHCCLLHGSWPPSIIPVAGNLSAALGQQACCALLPSPPHTHCHHCWALCGSLPSPPSSPLLQRPGLLQLLATTHCHHCYL